jgi:cytochrome c-type biogenesis protein CcmH/NrfF
MRGVSNEPSTTDPFVTNYTSTFNPPQKKDYTLVVYIVPTILIAVITLTVLGVFFIKARFRRAHTETTHSPAPNNPIYRPTVMDGCYEMEGINNTGDSTV